MPFTDPEALDARGRYLLMISAVVPRPIAWVTTLFPDGSANAAPFSYFSGVSSTPPVVSVAVGHRVAPGEGWKDTARNARDRGAFVVNMVPFDAAPAMVASSGVSEVDRNGLALVPSRSVEVPGLAAARLRLECRLHSLVEVEGARTTLILGRVTGIATEEGMLRPDGTADLAALDPVGRLGGETYCRVREPFVVPRPRRG
jgi:flavin reductase (DIM6/NTAB) family NADH-FMN oxidoreductase RutF